MFPFFNYKLLPVLLVSRWECLFLCGWVQGSLPIFSSNRFSVSNLFWQSFIHLELSFVQYDKYWLIFILLHAIIFFDQHYYHLVKILFLFPANISSFFIGSFSIPLIMSVFILILCSFYFYNLVVQWYLQIIFRIILAILWFLCSLWNLKSSFLSSISNFPVSFWDCNGLFFLTVSNPGVAERKRMWQDRWYNSLPPSKHLFVSETMPRLICFIAI